MSSWTVERWDTTGRVRNQEKLVAVTHTLNECLTEAMTHAAKEGNDIHAEPLKLELASYPSRTGGVVLWWDVSDFVSYIFTETKS